MSTPYDKAGDIDQMAEFVDLGAHFADSSDAIQSNLAFAVGDDPSGLDTHRASLFEQSEQYLQSAYIDDWSLPEPVLGSNCAIEEPDYGRFEDWIPHLSRPEFPCDYCNSRGLNCFILPTETACTPCKTLFRECSLSTANEAGHQRPSNRNGIDTLHVVDEDQCKEQGSLTGHRSLKSVRRSSGASTPVRSDDAPGSSKRNGIRFPKPAVKTLRDWLHAHADHPYPTEEEKLDLMKRTELTTDQISNWLANARRRKKNMAEIRRPHVLSSPTLKPSTLAMAIPRANKPWDELNPLERWKHSPPENDPASIRDIAQAVANSDFTTTNSSPASSLRRKRSSNGSGRSGISKSRALSTGSGETGQTSSQSVSTKLSSRSHGSFGSFSSGLAGKKDRRRRPRPLSQILQRSDTGKQRIFQCTFCTDTFKSKYDWTRHEKSLHLSLEKWICAPSGPVVQHAENGQSICAYCGLGNPSADHVETHNHLQCEEKGIDARTFYRKDHLRQHMRLMHDCEMAPHMEAWKAMAIDINSRCGFCSQRFSNWQDRNDHLAAHFRAGAHMRDWKGCRGLDPAVAAQVTNAMPPYLIGEEASTMNPFSASDSSTWRFTLPGSLEDVSQLERLVTKASNMPSKGDTATTTAVTSNLPKSTCWELLTIHLSKFARDMAREGVPITDEMLQARARVIVYDSDDNWNQTPADNPQWLDLFKKAHGLDYIPSTVGGKGSAVPDDLETYGDLGLRIPFAVLLDAYNSQKTVDMDPACAEWKKKWSPRRLEILRAMRQSFVQSGVLRELAFGCEHAECAGNEFDGAALMDAQSVKPMVSTWCNEGLSLADQQALMSLASAARCCAAAKLDMTRTGSNLLSSMITTTGINNSTTEQQTPNHDLYSLTGQYATSSANLTDPWLDSSVMPSATNTINTPSSDAPGTVLTAADTSTGAMMEFLGGRLGQNLPFSTASATEPILSKLPMNEFTTSAFWPLPTTTSSIEPAANNIEATAAATAVMNELEKLLFADPATVAEELKTTTSTTETPLDFGIPLEISPQNSAKLNLDLNAPNPAAANAGFAQPTDFGTAEDMDPMEMDFDQLFDMDMRDDGPLDF